MNPDRCPVVTTDFELIHRYLSELPLDELIFVTEDIIDTLSPTEKINYDISRFCSSYSDVEGRINFVRALIDNAIISTVHIPFSYNRDERLINLLKAKQYDFYLPMAQGLKEEAAALTDDLEQVTDTIKVTNPRWEHVDKTRKENSPKVTSVGDTIMLMVDVTGFKGQWISFDIFDTSGDPAMRIETVKGKIEDGTARKEWVVSDPNERASELKLEFEGSARSKSSGRAPIDLGTVYRVELKDEEGNVLEGIRVEFTVPGEEPVVVETDADGVAEHSAKDPAVKADVRVLWDGNGEVVGNQDGNDEQLSPGNIIISIDDPSVANAEYSIKVDQEEITNKVDGSGLLEPNIPENSTSFDLVVKTDPELSFTVEIAPLKQTEDVLGIKQRLRNIGYTPGNMDSTDNNDFKAAVRAFQYKTGITVDGIAGAETQSKLREVYGY